MGTPPIRRDYELSPPACGRNCRGSDEAVDGASVDVTVGVKYRWSPVVAVAAYRLVHNWYNDISTRDRSREGAEEAIDLSEGFKNPNYELGPAPPRARGLALWDVRGQDAASVRRCRSAKIGHQ